MDDWFSFKTSLKGGTVGVDAKIASDSKENSLTVSLEIVTDSSATVTMKVDIGTGSITTLGVQSLTSLTACVAACAVGAAVGPLISCFNRNIKKYIACLKSKGLDAAADLAKCVVACVIGAP
jgi:hypothetical protein